MPGLRHLLYPEFSVEMDMLESTHGIWCSAQRTSLVIPLTELLRVCVLNQTSTLGLVIADVENSFYSRIAKTVEVVAKQAGFHVILCNSNDNPLGERECLELLVRLRADGILITPTGKNITYLQTLLSRNVNMVQLDRRVSNLRC